MEGGTSSGGAGAGAGGGGPAPFLMKTYDMVDDSATDAIVSWSSAKNSFVVWNPPEFARLLLPTYFKHNNFSSFIRQLNTYGFRKIDPERWEFSNEDFVKDQKHLLKNIHRRKPIHSHSHSHSHGHNHPQGSSMDPERAAFEEEIERLSREKADLEARVAASVQRRKAAKQQLDDLTHRTDSVEKRQVNLLTTLEKAVHNPAFLEQLAKKIESLDDLAYTKKRRLPEDKCSKTIPESSLLDNDSSSRPEFGSVINQDFSNKLRLELLPAVSDINLVSRSTQSSNEDGGSPLRNVSDGDPKYAQARTETLSFAPETLELSDTGASFAFKMDESFPQKVPATEGTKLHSLQSNLGFNEEVDGHMSCHLNLTLAFSPLQVNQIPNSSRGPQLGQGIGKSLESSFGENAKEAEGRVFPKNRNADDEDATLPSSKDISNSTQGPPPAPVRVNDVFWEQFLTERPGFSDNEEASSTYRANPYDDQDDRRSSHGMTRSGKNKDQLSL
ncbi:putative DNA binding protein [Tripterygium wilfordii]|uniref:Putative DNA binding protein n=1 Tax=Tripterygium wilfordii TaxID=458696 RepID=A0A7J7CWQ3_TRIWF|nr:heat stress transcription factor A-5 [Tripterygium wilfordii]XP_038720677.1 heat stress transcription factor A-5 [Tripterygium wilfordii]XP_038720678.1 heat stress transcription factor A-5 [Tripterygium wilfordii]KAF5738493.1 putative DNA binding protein [Tripterygium wilfordii]